MNQIDYTNLSLPPWLKNCATAIEQLSETGTGLGELLEDHARLTEAMQFWNGKSAERVEEFGHLAKEIEREIMVIVTAITGIEAS
jgi:hypothetical protein